MTSTSSVPNRQLHIVVVEDDHFEQEIASFDLVATFPSAKITLVRNGGDFLIGADRLRDADIVVMEHQLPLGALGSSEDATDKWFANLKARFPDITESWNRLVGGERLALWMRRNGFAMPILFHTYSDLKDLAEDITSDPKVFYSTKHECERALGAAVLSALNT